MTRTIFILGSIFTLILAALVVLASTIGEFREQTSLLLGANFDSKEPTTIWLIDTETTLQTPIGNVHAQSLSYGGTDVRWSPDGDFIDLLGYDLNGEDRVLDLYEPHTGQTTRLSNALVHDFCINPAQWSPTGRYLAYVDGQMTESRNIYIFDTTTHETHRVTTIDNPWFYVNWTQWGTTIWWSPDEQSISVHIPTESGAIKQGWSISGVLIYTKETINGYWPSHNRITFSPNHRYLLLQMEDIGSAIFDLRRGRRIGHDLPANLGTFNWNLQTNDLIYTFGKHDNWTLAVHDLKTDQSHVLTSGEISGRHGWYQTGQFLYFAQQTQRNGPTTLAVWDLAANGWAYQSEHAIRELFEAWPDGHHIAYSTTYANQEDTAGFYLLDTRTWHTTRLITYTRENIIGSLLWSPDQRHVLIHLYDWNDAYHQPAPLYLVDTFTQAIQQVPGSYMVAGPTTWYKWSDSGRYLVIDNAYTLEVYDTHRDSHSTHPLDVVYWEMAFSPDERYLTVGKIIPSAKTAHYLLRLETQTLQPVAVDRFVGWQNGDAFSLLFCPEA